MENIIKKLEGISLFDKIRPEELSQLMPCVKARVGHFEKGEIILLAGEKIREVGIVLSGSVQVMKEDAAGNRNIFARLSEKEIFAEVLNCAGIEKSPVTVLTDTGAGVLFLDFRRVIVSCGNACAFHSRLIQNMLRLVALKNLSMNDKITCLGHRTTREKVEAFLELQLERAGKNPFYIPFSRAQMADYLCVDRSALSAVLCKMRDEGQIRFEKNRFEIL